MPYYAVDRLEGEIAVLVADDTSVSELPSRMLPHGIHEGSILRVELDASGAPIWSAAVIDKAEQDRRLREMQRKLKELRAKDPGGDITL